MLMVMNVRKVMTLRAVFVVVNMRGAVGMRVLVAVHMAVVVMPPPAALSLPLVVPMLSVSIVPMHMDVELNAGQVGLLTAPAMQVITLESEFPQLTLERVEIDTQIDQGSQEHVTAQPAEDVQV
jgi:hypothetical protein